MPRILETFVKMEFDYYGDEFCDNYKKLFNSKSKIPKGYSLFALYLCFMGIIIQKSEFIIPIIVYAIISSIYVYFKCNYIVKKLRSTYEKKAKQKYDEFKYQWIFVLHLSEDDFYKIFPNYLECLSLSFVVKFLHFMNMDTSNKNHKQKVSNKNLQKALSMFGFNSITDVNENNLKQKYRILAKKYHPDSQINDNSITFQDVQCNYELLKSQL